jgi:hypothetical protein
MPYKKGFDPNRNVDQIFRPGDGKTRKPFVKGDDPRRISNERLQEVNFKKGHTAAHNEDGPKVAPDARVDLIPMAFQVEISPSTSGKDLLPMLNHAIEFGERMMGLIVSGPKVKIEEEVLGDEEPTDVPETQEDVTRKHLASRASVENALAIGLYTELLSKCIKTRAEIEGGGLKPAMFGKLDEESVDRIKDELAFLLHCNLTKLNHGLHYANNHNIFDKSGGVQHWADKSMRALLSGIRTTIETRARLDIWEHKKDRKMIDIEARLIEVIHGS